jgi:hypothetical protein
LHLFISDKADFSAFAAHIPIDDNSGQQQTREQSCHHTD